MNAANVRTGVYTYQYEHIDAVTIYSLYNKIIESSMCQHMGCWLLITAVNESWVINIDSWAVENSQDWPRIYLSRACQVCLNT